MPAPSPEFPAGPAEAAAATAVAPAATASATPAVTPPPPSGAGGNRRPASRTQAQYVFVAGAVSGIVEGLSIQPLEMIKTRFQIHEGAPLRLSTTFMDIVREGGVKQLYRGALPEITGLMPRASAALSTLEFTQRFFKDRDPAGRLTAPAAFASGAMSGVSEGVAFQPFQVVKVRLMAKQHLGRYRNTLDCARQILRDEGVLGFSRGLSPTLFRNCIWNALYYGTVHQLESAVMTQIDDPFLRTARTLVVGTAVGMVATTANIPFDVVKSRMQSELPGPGRKYVGVFPSLAYIVRQEGLGALYKGFLPKALRLGIGQTFGLLVFQNCLALFRAAPVDDLGAVLPLVADSS